MSNAPQRLAPLIEVLKGYRSKGMLATHDDEEKALWEDVSALEGYYDEYLEAESFDSLDDDEDEFYNRAGYPSHQGLFLPMERLLDAIIGYAAETKDSLTPDPRLQPSV